MNRIGVINFLICLFLLLHHVVASNSVEQGQVIKGLVFDRDSHEPLIGATVVVEGHEPLIGGSSDRDGRFVLKNVPFGRVDLRISYLGYETKYVRQLLVTAGKELVLEVDLQQNIEELDEVVIVPQSSDNRLHNPMANVSALSFTVEETRRYAGGIDDPARLVSVFSGVTTGSLQDNSIIVRGNAPQGVAWRLEGVEIPTPHHFAGANVTGGGMVTLFSSQVMANSDFYTSAFPAEYGNALAAVFDMKLRTGNREKYEHAVQVGLLGIDVASEGPFSKKSDASYLFNYRYSTFGLLADLKLIDTEQLFKYQDLSFKLNFPMGRAGVLSLWGIGGKDRATEDAVRDSERWEVDFDRISFVWDTYMGTVGLNHKLVIGRQSYLHTTLALSGVRNKMVTEYINDDFSFQPDMDLITNSSTVTLSAMLSHKFNAKWSMRAGFTCKRPGYDLSIAGTEAYVPGTYRHLLGGEGHTNSYEGFSQFKYEGLAGISFNAGAHFRYFGLNKELSSEPRAGVRFTLHPKHQLQVGYGMHSRPEELKMYFMEIEGEKPNRELKLSKAHHVVLGYSWQIARNLHFRAEGYYQHLYDIPGEEGTSYSLINYKQDYTLLKKLTNNTIGRNAGVDLTLEKALSNDYYFLLTTSLFDAKYRGGDNVWRPTRYNKRYVANLLMGRERFFKNNRRSLDYNIRLNVTGGERYSPVLVDESIALQRIVTDESRAFALQHDPVLYADLAVSYRINHRKALSLISLQVKNAFGSPIVENFNYNFKTNRIQLDKNRPILPVISYKIEF